ncbi:P-loop containing nucleoside triphosphate hydrolase protein [Penicillium malachiteum]|nr:P-loop containing nucleoside triphosphate hydrolase protein [Penicillium malachiteum]
MACPQNSDNKFGPRIDPNCRSFDFTLLLEDALFSLLPATLFLLLIPPRLHVLWRAPTKLRSYRLAIVKSVPSFLLTPPMSILVGLTILHVSYTALLANNPALHTDLGTPSRIINVAVTVAAIFLSFLEDQRSEKPSDLLILYYSATTLLFLPQIRSLWQIPNAGNAF